MEIGIISMIKDELPYLDEWIKYHLSIGFDVIYLVEDIGSKPHDVSLYKQVKILDLKGLIRQTPKYKVQKVIANYVLEESKLDWLTHIDIDEYIFCRKGTLKENLLNLSDSFLMKWLNYNANGHITRPLGGLLLNYTLPCGYNKKDLNTWVYKAFISPKSGVQWLNPHYTTNYYKLDDIYIKHFITKSFEDWCYRIYERGDMLHRVYRNLDLFFELNRDIDRLKCMKFLISKYGEGIKELYSSNSIINKE